MAFFIWVSLLSTLLGVGRQTPSRVPSAGQVTSNGQSGGGDIIPPETVPRD
jgi:hypothetical protein